MAALSWAFAARSSCSVPIRFAASPANGPSAVDGKLAEGDHKPQGRPALDRLDDQREVAGSGPPHRLTRFSRDPATVGVSTANDRRAHRRPQRPAQDREQIEAGRAGRRLQIPAGLSPREAHDLVVAVDHEIDRRIRLDHAARALVDAVVEQCRTRRRRRRRICTAVRPQPRRGRPAVVAPLQNAMLLVEQGEQFRVARHPFRRAQEQVSAGLQGVVERPDHALLQLAVQIDQHVAAGDQVEFGERRVS